MNAVCELIQAHAVRERSSKLGVNSQRGGALADQAVVAVEQLQSELNAVREQLARSNRMSQLGMLAAALAHETNNLLTPIRSYAQLALANPGDVELNTRALQVAIDGTYKAGRLVERAMGLAAPQSPIQTAVCKASEVAAEALAMMAPVMQQFSVTISEQVDPVSIAIDALTLEQVLINLIGNACQAMAQTTGKRKIHIASNEVRGRLVLSVSDNGPGVPKAIRDELFEPFVTDRQRTPEPDQPGNSSVTAKPGSGLGLSICRQLLEEAGGKITLADSSEAGSRFEIDVPLAAKG